MSAVRKRLAAQHAALMASTSALAIGTYWIAKAQLERWQSAVGSRQSAVAGRHARSELPAVGDSARAE